MPQRPATRLAQKASTLCPREVTAPRPVITTRREDEESAIMRKQGEREFQKTKRRSASNFLSGNGQNAESF
jgi:hypothetical protein